MKVAQVKCPRCGKASYSKTKDSLVLCDGCRSIHTISPAGPVVYEYEVAEFAKRADGKKVHIPFWRLFSRVTIFSENVTGAWVQRLFEGGPDGAMRSGSMFLFVPAIELPPEIWKRWAQDLTTNPPQYRGLEKFEGERVPCAISEEDARKLADFLVLTFEAEKPGVLQDIRYELTVEHTKLVYLPFHLKDGGGYEPAT